MPEGQTGNFDQQSARNTKMLILLVTLLDTRIVDQDIKRRERLEHAADSGTDRGLVANVELHYFGTAAQRADLVTQAGIIRVALQQAHICPCRNVKQ